MQRILGWIYSDLLEFHIKAQQFFRRLGWKRVFKADWGDFDLRFQGILASLQRHHDLTESLARLAYTNSSLDTNLHLMEKLSTYVLDRDKLFIELDVKEKEDRDKKYWHVMEWLASLRLDGDKGSHEQLVDHESFCEVRRENTGSGNWIMQNETVVSWINDATPRYPVLWLNGIPGAGKRLVF